MGNNEKARQAQFELVVSYMERYGDIQYVLERMESQRRRIQLTNLLNNKSLGEPKPVGKWREAKTVQDEDPCEMPLSPVSQPQCYIRDGQYEQAGHRKSSTYSFTSETSYEETSTLGRRKRSFKDNLIDVADQ